MAQLVCGLVRIQREILRRRLHCMQIVRHANTETKAEVARMKENPVTTSKVTNYVLARYLAYVKSYQSLLEARFPIALRVYRVFSVGIKEFYRDIKHFLRVARRVHISGNTLRDLNRRDIEVYYQMPKDMQKMVPVLLVSALPFANYVVFPLAYIFPKRLLSPHFWSLQQRVEFAVEKQRQKLYNYRPVFRCLQEKLDTITDLDMKRKCTVVIHKVGSGVHPEVKEILSIKELFRTGPYHLNCLNPKHLNGLLKVHGVHSFWARKRKLEETAIMIHEMDMAILREGISSIGGEDIRWACFIRGLNPINMRDEDMVLFLKQWTRVSSQVDEGNFSLLLHCPILLTYNHPTNWVLTH